MSTNTENSEVVSEIQEKLTCLVKDKEKLLEKLRESRAENERLKDRWNTSLERSMRKNWKTKRAERLSLSSVEMDHGGKCYEELENRLEELEKRRKMLVDENKELRERIDELEQRQEPRERVRLTEELNEENPIGRPGNSGKSVAKPKAGQPKAQKFSKSCSPSNRQRNTFPNKNKGRGYQNPQRQGYLADKRPSARGVKETERYQQLSVEDKDLDLDYDFPVASRKNSLNHLLNFTFAPREQSSQYLSTTRKKGGFKGSPYNKEQFLQANCQFVVQDGEDYSINSIDPDAIVDWQLIEQVRVRCTEMPSCPICLYPPTAAQVTRCGHIYCWSCILHYLSLSEKTWRKCPICYESIHKNDLKSVMAVSDHKHIHGQEMTMSLMKRSKSSVRALPSSKWVESEALPLLSSDEVEMKFSKFLRATPQEILTQVMVKVRSELESLLLEVESDKSEEKPFVTLAIEEFQKREQRLLEMCKKNEKYTTGSQAETTCGDDINHYLGEEKMDDKKGEWKVGIDDGKVQDKVEVDDRKVRKKAEVDDRKVGEKVEVDDRKVGEKVEVDDKKVEEKVGDKKLEDSVEVGDRKVEEKEENGNHDKAFVSGVSSSGVQSIAEKCRSREKNSRSSVSSDDSLPSHKSSGNSQFYYFYQAEDGQQIFLHPVNARCLIKEYGSLENCPETITGHIVEMECLTQTEQLRRRYAYLRHLPLTCEFAICELDLKPPVLSRSTLNYFKDDLRKRRTRRHKKAEAEARHDDKCRSNFTAYPGIEQPTAIFVETPDLSSEQDFPQQVSSDAVWVASSPPASGPWSTSPSSEKEILQPGQSFAEALSTGKSSNQPKPKKRTEVPRRGDTGGNGLEASDEEEGDIVPSFQAAFNDALMLADWNLNVEAVAKDDRPESGSGKKNKRKNKKRVLFSTGSSRKL